MNYPPPTNPAPAAQRHRRSDRHRQADQPAAPAQFGQSGAMPPSNSWGAGYCVPPNARSAAPMPQGKPAYARPAPAVRRKKKKRASGRGLNAAQWVVLAMLTVCLLGAAGFRLYAESRMRILMDDRARAAQEYQDKVDRYLAKQRPYRALIEQYAAQYGVDPAFVSAIIMEESNYDPRAVSSKGARGLMQFMPNTFDWVKKNCGYKGADFDVVYQPEAAIKMGCYLLKYIIGQLGTDDPILVTCAYHAGWGHISTWVSNYSTDGKTLTVAQIPAADTRTYAGRVINSYAIYLQNVYEVDGGAAGFDAAVSPGDGHDHGSIPVPGNDLGENQVYQSAGGGRTGVSVSDVADL